MFEILLAILFCVLLWITYRVIKKIGRSIVGVFDFMHDAISAYRPYGHAERRRASMIDKNIKTLKEIADHEYHKQVCAEIRELEESINKDH
jgi:sensor histidine kinase YesM